MKAQIWKFVIPAKSSFEIEMPDRAEIINVALQDGQPCLWAIVPMFDVSPVERRFKQLMTGSIFETKGLKHLGTYQPGELVFHLFEEVQ